MFYQITSSKSGSANYSYKPQTCVLPWHTAANSPDRTAHSQRHLPRQTSFPAPSYVPHTAFFLTTADFRGKKETQIALMFLAEVP